MHVPILYLLWFFRASSSISTFSLTTRRSTWMLSTRCMGDMERWAAIEGEKIIIRFLKTTNWKEIDETTYLSPRAPSFGPQGDFTVFKFFFNWLYKGMSGWSLYNEEVPCVFLPTCSLQVSCVEGGRYRLSPYRHRCWWCRIIYHRLTWWWCRWLGWWTSCENWWWNEFHRMITRNSHTLWVRKGDFKPWDFHLVAVNLSRGRWWFRRVHCDPCGE